MSAYRRQLSGQILVLAYQWLLAGYVTPYGQIQSDDWDEANTFCKPDHGGGDTSDHKALEESPPLWLEWFYDTMEV